jgi:hypothetical protein
MAYKLIDKVRAAHNMPHMPCSAYYMGHDENRAYAQRWYIALFIKKIEAYQRMRNVQPQ